MSNLTSVSAVAQIKIGAVLFMRSDELRQTLHRDLLFMGRAPRVISLVQLVVAGVFCGVVLRENQGVLIACLALLPFLIVFCAALRIRASLVDDDLVVRSYWSTYIVPIREGTAFMAADYDGAWTLGRPTSLIMQVEAFRGSRVTRSMRAMMCGRSRALRIGDHLNALAGAPEGDYLWDGHQPRGPRFRAPDGER